LYEKYGINANKIFYVSYTTDVQNNMKSLLLLYLKTEILFKQEKFRRLLFGVIVAVSTALDIKLIEKTDKQKKNREVVGSL